MRAMARRLLSRSLVRALNQWVVAAEEHLRLRHFARRMVDRHVVKALNQWSAAATERLRLRQFARQMIHRHVVKVLNQLQAVSSEAQRMRQVVRRMLLRGLSRALSQWVGATEEGLRLMRLLRRAAQRLSGRMLMRVFIAWAALLGERARARQEGTRAIANRLRHHSLTVTYEAWRDHVAEVSVQRDQRRRAVMARLTRRLEVLVLDGWRRYVQESRDKMGLAALRWARSELWHAFHQLRANSLTAHLPDEVPQEAAAAGAGAEGMEALTEEVAALRRQLTLTRRELVEISRVSARKYELAVVRAELLARQNKRPTSPPAHFSHPPPPHAPHAPHAWHPPPSHPHRSPAGVWTASAATEPPHVFDHFLDDPDVAESEGRTAVDDDSARVPRPPSPFVRVLQEQAPHLFPPSTATIATTATLRPPRPSSARATGHVPSPRATRLSTPPGGAPALGSALPLELALDGEPLVRRDDATARQVIEHVQRNLQYHAQRLGLVSS